jgi:homoserine kinase type II
LAVYTEIPENELTGHLSRYDIGELHSIKGIAEGVENSNFLLSTDGGTFILTLYEKRVEEADLPYFLGLMAHLAGKGIKCPQPIAMRDGEVLGRLVGRPAAIVSYLDGISLRRPRNEHCAQLGEALAEFHLAAADFEMKRPNALGIGGWRPLFERSAARADEVEPGLAQLISDEIDFLERNWPADLPSGVIHADLFPDNVLFLKDRLSGLIDFYFACNDTFAYDFAVCLNAWCFERDSEFNVTKAQAMLNGYVRVRPFLAGEFASLPVLCRGAALRFLLTRLFDWLNVPAGALVTPKNPAEYVARLRFHAGIANTRMYGITLPSAAARA